MGRRFTQWKTGGERPAQKQIDTTERSPICRYIENFDMISNPTLQLYRCVDTSKLSIRYPTLHYSCTDVSIHRNFRYDIQPYTTAVKSSPGTHVCCRFSLGHRGPVWRGRSGGRSCRGIREKGYLFVHHVRGYLRSRRGARDREHENRVQLMNRREMYSTSGQTLTLRAVFVRG